MAGNLQQMELEALMHRPRGGLLVFGVTMRVLVAAGLFALFGWAVVSSRADFAVPVGDFRVSHCSHDWDDYQCVGTLRTATGGHLVTPSAILFGYRETAGSTIKVSYDDQQDLSTNATGPAWLARRDALMSVSLGVAGAMSLVSAVRRVRPDLAWLRPETKQWGRLSGLTTATIILCAVASEVCAVIGFA